MDITNCPVKRATIWSIEKPIKLKRRTKHSDKIIISVWAHGIAQYI